MRLGGNQERYLLAERNSRSTYFITVWFEARGTIDVKRFRLAVDATIRQHASLRTGFEYDAECGFRPIVHKEARYGFHEAHIGAATHDAVARACESFLRKPTDFSDPGSLQHSAILWLGPDHAVLVFSQHHSISDGRSLDIFLEQVASAYNDASCPAPAEAENGVDYERSPASVEAASRYFETSLAGAESVPRLHRNCAGEHSPAADYLELDNTETALLDSASANSSPFSVLASVFAIQIAGLTGSHDVIFSIQSMGRSRDDLRIGSFSNALPVRIGVDPLEPFSAMCQRMRTLVRATVEHEALPYHRIQQLSGVRPDFAINLYPSPPQIALDKIQLGPREFLPSDSDYGVNLRWQRRREAGGDTYAGECYFDAGRVERPRIMAFNARYLQLLNDALENPSITVADLLAKSALAQPDGALPAIPPTRIFEAVYEAARAHGEREAISFEQGSISYSGLVEQVETLAGSLAAKGVKQGDRVAFLASRSPDLPITMLALSRLGAVFAAFDSEYPDSRLIEQANAFGPDMIIAASRQDESRLHGFEEAGFRTCVFRRDENALPAPLPGAAGPTDIAYVLFTSGTQGTPRPVRVGHSALPAFLNWQRTALSVREEDRVSLLSGLAHDPVMRDLFLPLTSGATLCIPPPSAIRDPRALIDWLRSAEISLVHTTPPMGKLLAEVSFGKPALPVLRILCWGGDILPQQTVNTFNDVNPELRQFNFYGATETPQAVCVHEIGRGHRDRQTVPIGTAIPLARVSIRGNSGKLVAHGELGQVTVATPYVVGLGDDVAAVGQDYSTGDLGYRLPNGEIQLIGRRDDQVKVRGYRVELQDVQRHVSALADVADAVVLPAKSPDGETVLVAHVRTNSHGEPDALGFSLSRQIARGLPAYMVPSRVFVHDAFPMLPNGKVDRQALIALQESSPSETTALPELSGAASWSDAERTIANTFEHVTGRKVPSPESCFTELGADSLNSIQAMLRLESVVNDLPDDWPEMSIRLLAAKVQQPHRRSLLEHLSLVRLDPSVILRAIAILVIVANHYLVWTLGGGFTFVLFFLGGAAFSRFQLPTVLRDSTGPVERALAKFFVIAFPIEMYYAAKLYFAHSPNWLPTLLFSANLVDYSQPGGPHDHDAIFLWFVGCYVQIWLALILILRVPAVRRALQAKAFVGFLVAFLGLAIMRFALPAVFRPDGLEGIPVLSIWTYLPTTRAPTFVLGILAEQARRGPHEKILILLIGLVYCFATDLYFPENSIVVTGLTLVTVLFVHTVSVPRIAARAIGTISQASLVIYLLHVAFHGLVKRIADLPAVVVFALAIVTLSLAGVKFDKFYRYARDRVRRHVLRLPDSSGLESQGQDLRATSI